MPQAAELIVPLVRGGDSLYNREHESSLPLSIRLFASARRFFGKCVWRCSATAKPTRGERGRPGDYLRRQAILRVSEKNLLLWQSHEW